MAIKDLCLQCVHFSENRCGVNNTTPNYDQMSCKSYKKRNIDLEKHSQAKNNDVVSISNEEQFVQKEKLKMFSYPFSFEGRIRRAEYGLSLTKVSHLWEFPLKKGDSKRWETLDRFNASNGLFKQSVNYQSKLRQ